MAENKSISNLWLRIEQALGLLALISVFCLIFILSWRAIFDMDIWLHLKAGEVILKNLAIPARDIFSHTLNGKPWIDHEWLFQIIVYLVYNNGGAEGLITLQTYVVIIIFILLFLVGRGKIKSFIEVAFFLLLTAYASSSRFNIRPDIFSGLFFVLYLYILRFHPQKKAVWLLLPVQVLWANIHGYFFLGPLLLLFFIGAEFLRRGIKFLPWEWKEGFALGDCQYRRLKMLFPFTILACFFTPLGLNGALYPFGIFKGMLEGKNRIFFQYIQELWPTFQGYNYQLAFYCAVSILAVSLMLVNFKRLKIIDIFLTVFFFLFGLTSRNVFFFAVVGFMMIIIYFSPLAEKIYTRLKLEPQFKQRLFSLIKYGVTLFFVFWVWGRIDQTGQDLSRGYYDFKNYKYVSLFAGLQSNRYPVEAVKFILKHNVEGKYFNDFNSGAYLIGSAYPKVKVFIDGRTELYGPDFFKGYQQALRGEPGEINRIFNKYKISVVLLSLTSETIPGMISVLHKDSRWKIVFFDEQGMIFLKDIPSNKELISRYSIDLNKYRAPVADLNALGIRPVYPAPYLKRAQVFQLMGEDALAIEEAKQALRVTPNSSQIFLILGKGYLNQKKYILALENLRAALLLSPRNLDALTCLGEGLREMKEYNSAAYALNGAIRFDKSFAPAHYQLGALYLATGKYSDALKALNQAVKYSPSIPEYRLKLGKALMELGERNKDQAYFVQAGEQFKKAARLNLKCDARLAREIRAQEKFLLQFIRVYDKKIRSVNGGKSICENI